MLTPLTNEVVWVASEADNMGALFTCCMFMVVAVDNGLGCEVESPCTSLVSTVSKFCSFSAAILTSLLCLGIEGVLAS